MALQVWLPLTKDLRNQGVNGAIVSNNGATYSATGGKLGGCYNFNNNYCAVNISLGATASIACWTKTSTDSKMSWVLEDDAYGYLNLFESSIYTLNAGDSNNNPFKTDSNSNISCLHDGQWHHFVVTFGNSVAKLYIDGDYRGTAQTFRNPTTTNKRIKIGGYYKNAHSYSWNGGINDFRVYDHCLSPMEVKQISQGLVLHYLLNSNNNLQIPFGYQQLEYIEGAGSSYFNTNYRFNPEIDGCTVEFKGNDTSNTGMIFADSGAKYFWFYYYGSSGIRVYANNGSGQQGIAGISSDLNKHIMRYENKHYYIDGVDKGNLSNTYSDDTNTIWLFTYGGGSYGFKGRIYYTEIRRNGIIQRMYIPAKRLSDSAIGMYEVLNNEFFTSASTAFTAGPIINTPSIVYDNSGYCHNGTSMNTTLSSSSDTIKYKDSINFNGTYDGILIENLALKDIINSTVTYAFWIKPNGENGARSVYFGSYNTGPSWSIEKTTGNVMRSYWNGSPDETCTGAAITDGVWQHVCITKNGTNDIKIYINGVQKWTSTATHSNLNFPTTFRIGRDTRSNDGTPYKGLMSDFRIYATALSAADVKSLYQNSAYIDSSGNIYGAIHSEV